MRFPNLRYGNPTEFAYYAMGRTHGELARVLRRDERTIRDRLSGKSRVPWWVAEIMRLQRMEMFDRQRQMFGRYEKERRAVKLGVMLPDAALQLREPAPETNKPRLDELRLDDFDKTAAAGWGNCGE
jgi:predicted transcriptional regulator